MNQPGPTQTRKGRFLVTKTHRNNTNNIPESQSRTQIGTLLNFDTNPSPPVSSSPSPPIMSFFSPAQNQPAQLQQFQPQQLQIQPSQQGQLFLYLKENKAPAGWGTKWEDLHPDSHKVLLQIEEKIRQYRDESEKLDQCSRLYDSSISNDSFELDASHIIQELGTTSTTMEREKQSIQKLSTDIKETMRNTEIAIHSYMLLRSRFANQNTPPVPVFDLYTGLPKRPSDFFVNTVERLRTYLEECIKWIDELEQLVQMEGNKNSTGTTIESLPKVMANLHDYFIYVASKVENLHQYVEKMKIEYLTEQRRRGDYISDPFLEADRRDAARRAAAAMRVHPTLHLPPATQSAAPQTPAPNPQQQNQTPQQTPSAGLFGASTPGVTGFGSGATGFGSTPGATGFGSTPGATGFGSTTTTPGVSGFGSTPAAATPAASGGFGTGATGFGSTSQLNIAGSNLFATPGLGGANVSGASFGGTSKAGRPKLRTGRR